jgi:hypothetical protein
MNQFRRVLLIADAGGSGGTSDEPESAEKTVTKGKKKAEDLSTERQVEGLRAELEKHKGDVQVSLAKIQEFIDLNPPAYGKEKGKDSSDPGLWDSFWKWLNS